MNRREKIEEEDLETIMSASMFAKYIIDLGCSNDEKEKQNKIIEEESRLSYMDKNFYICKNHEKFDYGNMEKIKGWELEKTE